MFQTTTIYSNYEGEVELCCFYERDRFDGSFAWMEFKEIKDDKYSDQNLVWDNPDYLFNNFYEFLHRWNKRECLPADKVEFSDIWNYLEETEGMVEELIEMLELALEQGWYERK